MQTTAVSTERWSGSERSHEEGAASGGDAQQALPTRTRDRKPKRSAAAQPEADSLDTDVNAPRGKRQRKAPEWMAKDFAVDPQDLPTHLQDGLAAAQAEAEKAPKPVKTGTRMTSWKLIDRHTLVVEMDHMGKKYRGVLHKSGVSPLVGQVIENFQLGSIPHTPGTASKDHCALCNQLLTKEVYPADPELQQVVKVTISSNWSAYTHLICALWAPEVFEDKHGNLVNLSGAVRRARALKCMKCKERGAGLCCSAPGCQRTYHLPCAQDCCQINEERFQLLCPGHASKTGQWPTSLST